MKTKDEITQCISNLNLIGCGVKVKYQNNTIYLEISGDNYFAGTKKQILNILHALLRSAANAVKFTKKTL